MWKHQNRQEFYEIIRDLIEDEQVLGMRNIAKHGKKGNCLDHSLYVAYLSFLFCRRFNLDYVAAARAGLLHDFYLYDYKAENRPGFQHARKHPQDALANAKELCELSGLEEDIIEKHMWPLTFKLPRHRESFVVSVADKIAASMELCRLYRAMRVQRHLTPANNLAVA